MAQTLRAAAPQNVGVVHGLHQLQQAVGHGCVEIACRPVRIQRVQGQPHMRKAPLCLAPYARYAIEQVQHFTGGECALQLCLKHGPCSAGVLPHHAAQQILHCCLMGSQRGKIILHDAAHKRGRLLPQGVGSHHLPTKPPARNRANIRTKSSQRGAKQPHGKNQPFVGVYASRGPQHILLCPQAKGPQAGKHLFRHKAVRALPKGVGLRKIGPQGLGAAHKQGIVHIAVRAVTAQADQPRLGAYGGFKYGRPHRQLCHLPARQIQGQALKRTLRPCGGARLAQNLANRIIRQGHYGRHGCSCPAASLARRSVLRTTASSSSRLCLPSRRHRLAGREHKKH